MHYAALNTRTHTKGVWTEPQLAEQQQKKGKGLPKMKEKQKRKKNMWEHNKNQCEGRRKIKKKMSEYGQV